MMNFGKIIWYFKKVFNLLLVILYLSIYCIFHPRKAFELLFILFSEVNNFYKLTKTSLFNFEESETFKKILNSYLIVRSNVFNIDLKVLRPMELQTFSALVAYFQPKTIFEIGTYNGFTSLHFLLNSPSDSTVFTLDLPPDYLSENKDEKFSFDDLEVIKLSMKYMHNRAYKNFPDQGRIKELFGDSMKFDFSPYYGKMDLVYIDGNHSLEYVKSDTENAMKMLSNKGIIVWHDYDYIVHKDIFNYLNSLAKQYKIYLIPHTRFAIYGKNLE